MTDMAAVTALTPWPCALLVLACCFFLGPLLDHALRQLEPPPLASLWQWAAALGLVGVVGLLMLHALLILTAYPAY